MRPRSKQSLTVKRRDGLTGGQGGSGRWDWNPVPLNGASISQKYVLTRPRESDTCLFFPSGSGYWAIRPLSKKEASRQGDKVVKCERDGVDPERRVEAGRSCDFRPLRKYLNSGFFFYLIDFSREFWFCWVDDIEALAAHASISNSKTLLVVHRGGSSSIESSKILDLWI